MTQPVEEILLKRMEYRLNWALSGKIFESLQIDPEPFIDHEADQIIYNIRCSVLEQQLDEHKYPSNWWEAFKEKWFSWIPSVKIRYTVINLKALYPKIVSQYDPVVIKRIRHLEEVMPPRATRRIQK